MSSNQASLNLNQAKFVLPTNDDLEQQQQQATTTLEIESDEDTFDYSKRLVSTASIMMGVGAVKHDIKAMILSGFAGLVAGACSMAIGEFVSVYSQLDIEVAQRKREKERGQSRGRDIQEEDTNYEEKDSLPNPLQAAAASALAFSVGAMVPLLAASFIREYKVRLGVIVAAVTFALVVFGWLGAVLGKAPVLRSALRVLFGGWMAMAMTFGLTKLIGSSAL